MAYSQQDNTQYLDPTTGQYYTEQTYVPPAPVGGYYGMGGYQQPNGGNFGMGSIGRNNYQMPRILRTNTGDISQVWKMLQNKQPYQYNVPSVASMFPSMSMPTMGNFQPTQYSGGAGQFLGGLLGNAPMAAPNAALASSGAGRFA